MKTPPVFSCVGPVAKSITIVFILYASVSKRIMRFFLKELRFHSANRKGLESHIRAVTCRNQDMAS